MQRKARVWVAAGLLLSVSVWSAAASLADDATQRRRLEGRWTGQIVDGGGEQGPVEVAEMLITPDRITARGPYGRAFGEGQYRLEGGQSLLNLDAMSTAGPGRGKIYLGVYSLEGDTLRWCVANPGRPRPTELVSRARQGQYLMILKRAR